MGMSNGGYGNSYGGGMSYGRGYGQPSYGGQYGMGGMSGPGQMQPQQSMGMPAQSSAYQSAFGYAPPQQNYQQQMLGANQPQLVADPAPGDMTPAITPKPPQPLPTYQPPQPLTRPPMQPPTYQPPVSAPTDARAPQTPTYNPYASFFRNGSGGY